MSCLHQKALSPWPRLRADVLTQSRLWALSLYIATAMHRLTRTPEQGCTHINLKTEQHVHTKPSAHVAATPKICRNRPPPPPSSVCTLNLSHTPVYSSPLSPVQLRPTPHPSSPSLSHTSQSRP
ncbi:hypothetical protein DPEC_G00173500 [Dallia pectoralis]|uniref:Uncharacterized protein n=1 Tax=Dallia pectoralis TaxID=75939 RepID=A0ACC2GDT8_DALPE|nr:hypothetical protein DPEC_G00173500 [Dallia pectoralis]